MGRSSELLATVTAAATGAAIAAAAVGASLLLVLPTALAIGGIALLTRSRAR